MDLAKRKCVPCEGNQPKLGADEIRELEGRLHGWQAQGDKLHKTFTFKDFVTAMEFLNRVAEVAEVEGHHPDFSVHYNQVRLSHLDACRRRLSENDFILAAKIDALV